MAVSESGVWLDNATGKVVTTEPTEGVQLVAPGGEVTPAVEAAIARAEGEAPLEVADAAPVETPEAPAKRTRKAAAPKG